MRGVDIGFVGIVGSLSANIGIGSEGERLALGDFTGMRALATHSIFVLERCRNFQLRM